MPTPKYVDLLNNLRRFGLPIVATVFAAVAFAVQQASRAASISYTPANLSLDASSTIFGGSDLQVSSSTLLLNWNRPAVDANHIGYWRLDAGSGTTAADDSSQSNAGTISGLKWASFGSTNGLRFGS